MVVQRGRIRRIGWVVQTLVVQVGQFVLVCKCLVSRGIVVQEQDHLGEIPVEFSLQNILQMHQERWLILRVDCLSLWKIINGDDAALFANNPGEIFSADFAMGIFWGWVSRYAATTLIAALSSVHSDITRYFPWPPIMNGNHFDCAE